jgi:hypothetical protein
MQRDRSQGGCLQTQSSNPTGGKSLNCWLAQTSGGLDRLKIIVRKCPPGRGGGDKLHTTGSKTSSIDMLVSIKTEDCDDAPTLVPAICAGFFV